MAESWQLIDGHRSSDGLTYTAVYWCSNTGAIKTETTSDGRVRAGDGPRIKRPTQAVEIDQLRQRVAEVEDKRDLNARMLTEELTRNEHLEAKLALAEQRLDWLADEIRLVDLWHAVYPHTPTTPAALREAIDAASDASGESSA